MAPDEGVAFAGDKASSRPTNYGEPTRPSPAATHRDGGGLLSLAINRCRKPVIAAINGAAAGLGLVFALYSDMRFASSRAAFSTAFARRGLIAEHGIAWLLPRVVGPGHAADLLYSARKVTAQEALQMGLVDRLYEPDSLMASTLAYADDLAENVSPRSIGVMKRQLWEQPFQTLAEATQLANAEMFESIQSEDFTEGVSHFIERRPARFTGR